MSAIRQLEFGGIRPAVSDRLLQQPFGTVAHNAELRKGYIKPFSEPKRIDATVVMGRGASVYKAPDTSACCGPVLTFGECVDAHPVELPGCAGFGLLTIFPRNRSEDAYRMDPCSGERWPLAVPAPTGQLTLSSVSASTMAGKDYVGPDERSYTYTWVDIFGVESAPAPASATIQAHDDEHVQVQGFSAPPPNAVAMRLYRTGSKLQSGKNIDMRFDEKFQLVREFDVQGTPGDYVDRNRLIELEYGTLETTENCTPPAGMAATVEMIHGYLAGFKDNRVMFSQRFEHWNWPDENVIELPDKVRAITALGDMLFIGTAGKTYRVTVSPNAEQLLSENVFTTQLAVVQSEENYPAMGQDTMVTTSFGAVYVSEQGLIAVQPQGPLMNISRARIDEDDWPRYAPNRLAWMNGVLYGGRGHASPAMIMDIRTGNEGKVVLGDLVTVDMPAQALHGGRDGVVYYTTRDGVVWAFDRGLRPMTYRWRSKKFTTNGLTAYSAAKIVADFGAQVKLSFLRQRDDGTMHVLYARTVDHDKPFRIPHQGRGLVWQFEVVGEVPLHEVHIAQSVVELVEAQTKP